MRSRVVLFGAAPVMYEHLAFFACAGLGFDDKFSGAVCTYMTDCLNRIGRGEPQPRETQWRGPLKVSYTSLYGAASSNPRHTQRVPRAS